MAESERTIPIAIAGGRDVRTERLHAKRIGGPFVGRSYRKAKSLVSAALTDALRRWSVSQRKLATVAGVDERLVRAWVDADGANGLRLDVALSTALDGDHECRGAIVDLLRRVLALAADEPSTG